MITFFAPPLRCADAFSFVVKKPVHSSTTSTFSEPQGQLGGIAFGEDLDAVARIAAHGDDDGVAVGLDRAGELAVRRVVLREVRVRLRIAEVVDRDDLEIVLLASFVVRAKDVAADAAVAVDGDFDGHVGITGSGR